MKSRNYHTEDGNSGILWQHYMVSEPRRPRHVSNLLFRNL